MTRTRTRLRWHRPCRNAPTADAPGKFIQRQVGNSDGISIPPTPVIATDRFPAAAPAYAQQDAAATATTTAHRNPAEEATPHDLGPHYDHTSWEWPMPSPAMARRFWDKPACSPRRDRTSAGTAASSGPMVLPTRRSWKRMAARTPMPQRYPPMAASSSDTANYRQAPWWRPPGSMPPPTRRSNCTTASTTSPRKRPEFPPTAR